MSGYFGRVIREARRAIQPLAYGIPNTWSAAPARSYSEHQTVSATPTNAGPSHPREKASPKAETGRINHRKVEQSLAPATEKSAASTLTAQTQKMSSTDVANETTITKEEPARSFSNPATQYETDRFQLTPMGKKKVASSITITRKVRVQSRRVQIEESRNESPKLASDRDESVDTLSTSTSLQLSNPEAEMVLNNSEQEDSVSIPTAKKAAVPLNKEKPDNTNISSTEMPVGDTSQVQKNSQRPTPPPKVAKRGARPNPSKTGVRIGQINIQVYEPAPAQKPKPVTAEAQSDSDSRLLLRGL